VRPRFSETIRSAFSSTSRCFITAIRLMSKCTQTSLTRHPPSFLTMSRIVRRTPPASALKTRSIDSGPLMGNQ
jgi:hypothetical protein